MPADPQHAALASEYAHADLVVSRAGATTVAELTAVGRPSALARTPPTGVVEPSS